MSTINLQAPAGIIPEKDELNRSEISDVYKRIAALNSQITEEKFRLKQLHRLERESKGLDAAIIDKWDLIKIIEDLLAKNSTISKAFKQHEVTEVKCRDWAKRTIKYSVDKTQLDSAFDALSQNTGLMIVRKYNLLDLEDVARAGSYSAALSRLKKQLAIANTLQDKDKQLADKESTIAARDLEIRALNKELLRDKSKDWKILAVTLQQEGVSVTNIAKRLGIARSTASTYLNSSGVKS